MCRRALIAVVLGVQTVASPVVAQLPNLPRCNPNPIVDEVILLPSNQRPAELATALVSDPATRARYGGLEYVTSSAAFGDAVIARFPVLDDPNVVDERLLATGDFTSVWVNGIGCFAVSPPDRLGTAVEYHHAGLDHYFIAVDASEQAALDSGLFAGWTRTGETFGVITAPGCPLPSTARHPVYRFYREPIGGPDTHFFSVGETECARVRDAPEQGWRYEGTPFWAGTPTFGACTSGQARSIARTTPARAAHRTIASA